MGDDSKGFDDFQLKEYENIATAHFESQKQLAVFFRYYMFFFSVPFFILSLLKDNNAWLTLKLFSSILLSLAILGLFFYWFAITLKYEAVLYARTVNGIRKYFYEKLNNPDIELKIKALPTDTKKPKYSSIANPLLIIIALVNTTYMALAFHFLNLLEHCYVYGLLLIFLITHIVINTLVTKNQVKAYP